jgi:hypothetical protein
MGAIFQVNENDVPWMEYEDSVDASGRAQIRVKPLTSNARDVPPVQYVEYLAGQTDPLHSHKQDEFFIITDGSLWLGRRRPRAASSSSRATPSTRCARATTARATSASSSPDPVCRTRLRRRRRLDGVLGAFLDEARTT